MAKKRIGELLLERKAVTLQQLEEGLAFHRQTGQRLGVALIQKGFLTEEQLARVLSEALGIEEVDLKKTQPDWSAIHMLRTRFCESNDLFPFGLEAVRGGRKHLLVAMSDPLNLPAIEEIEFTTGLKVVPRVAPLSSIRAAILRYYHKLSPADADARTMTIIQPGGEARVVDVDTGEVRRADEEEVIVGEEVKEITERTALADLIRKREEQRRARRKGRAPGTDALSKDLDYLFGVKSEGEVEGLERKFWALMRLMAKKGLISKDEFSKELDQD
ncbi:MAG TPA: hypothetical protein VH208_07925 [Myxococcaceae bacterium]|nr:hypothetical protein [Myxococcaceae bacterium]